jgi:hypothetical protein
MGRNPHPITEKEMKIKFVIAVLLVALMLPALASAQSRATFRVTKDFTDNNPAEVTVAIDCNTGLVLDQDKEISEAGGFVEFVVTDFTTNPTCTITETLPAGYSDNYVVGGTPGAGSGNYSGGGTRCQYLTVGTGSAFTCAITNSPLPVDVVITKEWVYPNGDATAISEGFGFDISCNAEITDESIDGGGDDSYIYSYQNGNSWYGYGYANGEAVITFEVVPAYTGTSCTVTESAYDSAVESDNGCGTFSLGIAQGKSCTITNSVFFEGIPTLSQYGMAIMAMLMLGVGFVGFRRFV